MDDQESLSGPFFALVFADNISAKAKTFSRGFPQQIVVTETLQLAEVGGNWDRPVDFAWCILPRFSWPYL